MKYVSARHGPYGGVIAIGDDGNEYHIPDVNTDVSPWPEYLKAGGTLGAYIPSTEPVPSTISDRQFFQQLAVGGLITESEALAAVQTGTLPAAIVAFIDQLPDEQQFPASMLLTGATSFERAYPLTEAFLAMYEMDGEHIDQLWRDAIQL